MHRVYISPSAQQQDACSAYAPSYLGLPISGMNTKIVFTRNSPTRTVLIDEVTGRELYRIDTTGRSVGRRVTSVFRRDRPVTPSAASNPIHTSELRPDVGQPHEGSGSEDCNPLAGTNPEVSDEGNGGNSNRLVGVAGEETPGEDSPLAENEIARWYWKWLSSPRLVFEGKISTRAEYMPLKGKMRKGYVFNHQGVPYHWRLPLNNLRCPRLVIESTDTLMAAFHLNLFRGKAYMEVTPAGMAMLDHIVVTFILVEAERRRG